MMQKIKIYLKLIRVKHYVKNILLFVPLFFAHQMTKGIVLKECIAFFAFSFMASSIYIINDIKDVEKDKIHPTKKNRPLASGVISKKNAIFLTCILVVFSLILNYFT